MTHHPNAGLGGEGGGGPHASSHAANGADPLTLTQAQITGLVTALAGKVGTDDSRLTDARTPTTHSHAISGVTGLQAALDAKAASSHTHATSEVTGLDTALAGKAASTHSHAIADVTGLQTALDAKVATNDSRLTDARTPTSHALTSHTASGLTAGHVLRATGASSYAFGALVEGDLPSLAQSKITNLTTDLAARVQLAGQLGGTAASPDVRGIRESGGTLLTLGAVADGQFLKRVGATLVGATPAGAGGGITKDTIALGAYNVLTNVGAAYDTIAQARGLGIALIDFTGFTALDFHVYVNKIGTGTQSWQLWNETAGNELAVINDTGAAGNKFLSTSTVVNTPTGLCVVRVRAKSTVATDDPVYYGAAIRVTF